MTYDNLHKRDKLSYDMYLLNLSVRFVFERNFFDLCSLFELSPTSSCVQETLFGF